MVFSTGSLFSKNDSSRFVKILAYISIRMRIFETKDVCAFSSISHTIQWISDRFQQMSPKSNVDVAVFLRHCYFWSKIAGIDSPGFMYRFCYFFTHDVEVMRRSKGQVFFHFFWTDDMGINDQIYTWHGTQDVIVDFGFILENNFWRFHFWGAICGPVRPDNGTAGPWPNGQVFFNFLTHDMGINDQIYTWDGTQGIIVGFGFILFFLGGFHFWGAICNFTAQDGTWKKWRKKKKSTIWAYIGEDGASRMAIWFQKKTLGLLSYCLDVYWGRLRPKNGHLVSEKIVRHFCPTIWAYIGEDGAPRMDIWFQDNFQGPAVPLSGRIRPQMAPQKWTCCGRTSFRDFCPILWTHMVPKMVFQKEIDQMGGATEHFFENRKLKFIFRL